MFESFSPLAVENYSHDLAYTGQSSNAPRHPQRRLAIPFFEVNKHDSEVYIHDKHESAIPPSWINKVITLSTFDSLPTFALLKRKELVVKTLSSYKELEEGWDFANAVKPEISLIDAALRLLEFFPHDIPYPYSMVSAYGEIGFCWVSNDVYGEISIDSPEMFSLYVRVNDVKFHKENMSISDRSIRDMREKLESIKQTI